MAYQNNNDNEDRSVQTRTNAVRSDKVATPILLLPSYQNDMMKLSFCNELPASQQTETKRFDRQNPIVTCVTREKCNVLYDGYKDLIEPMIKGEKEKEFKSVSVTVADVNQVALVLEKDDNGDWKAKLKLMRGINPDTLVCDNIVDFTFPMGEYIVDYDPKTGNFGDRKITYNGIEVFVSDMHEFSHAASKAYVHAARCVDKSYKDMVYDAIVQIGHKLGVELKSYGNGTGNSRYGSTGSIFDRGANNSSINSQPTMTLDELEQSLGDNFMNVPDDADEELPFQ